MPDAATLSLAELNDPARFQLKGAVAWFRAHRRRKPDGGEIVVTYDDLAEIVEHMRALEAEGRCFRLTNGHINPFGDEDEQPELLGFGRNARLGTFGPQNIDCIWVDEYADRKHLPTLQQRPYRSPEYYAQSKKITGCAALLRDPELNLGIVLYSADREPWHYAESIKMPDTTPAAAANDFTPEETAHFEKMTRYLTHKFPKLFGPAPAAIGPTNAAGAAAAKSPEEEEEAKKLAAAAAAEKAEQMRHQGETPELYAVRMEAEKAQREAAAAKKEAAALRQERERDKCERIIERLAVQYRMDPAREVNTLLPLSPAEREAHIAYIRAHYSESPDAEPIEIYSGHVEGGMERDGKPPKYDAIINYLRKHPGASYEDAEAAVK